VHHQYEKQVLEKVRDLDFEKLKTIKQLDLAQHEKNLIKKHNIAVRLVWWSSSESHRRDLTFLLLLFSRAGQRH
jgi:hypothetical protein